MQNYCDACETRKGIFTVKKIKNEKIVTHDCRKCSICRENKNKYGEKLTWSSNGTHQKCVKCEVCGKDGENEIVDYIYDGYKHPSCIICGYCNKNGSSNVDGRSVELWNKDESDHLFAHFKCINRKIPNLTYVDGVRCYNMTL